MAMSRPALRLFSWGLLASRSLCTASSPVGSGTASESKALSEFKPLYRRLSALGSVPGGSVAETMKEWRSEGRRVIVPELLRFVREFRRYKNYKTSLELIDWMEASSIKLSPSIHALRLHLVARYKGIDEAEHYFSNLPESSRNQKTYGALLVCYCEEKQSDKAIAILDKMRERNIGINTLTYNNLMSLHMNSGHPEKIASLYQEMQAANVSPDSFTHCHLMNSRSSMDGVDSVESFVRAIEKDSQRPPSWCVYSNLASHFIAAGCLEKAESALSKLEEVMDRSNRLCYHFLISMYAGVGNQAEVIRVWKVLKNSFPKTTNKSFLVMFQACVKLEEMDILKQCYEEWKCVFLSFDVRLPYRVMATFLRKDMMEEAELVLNSVAERGYGNDGLWGNFLGYLLRKKEMGLALKSLKFAISRNRLHPWSPKEDLWMEFFVCFGEGRDVERAEEFFKIFKDVYGADMDACRSLLSAYLAAAGKDSALRRLIEEDGFELSSEESKI